MADIKQRPGTGWVLAFVLSVAPCASAVTEQEVVQKGLSDRDLQSRLEGSQPPVFRHAIIIDSHFATVRVMACAVPRLLCLLEDHHHNPGLLAALIETNGTDAIARAPMRSAAIRAALLQAWCDRIAPEKVLDVACGAGRNALWLATTNSSW